VDQILSRYTVQRVNTLELRKRRFEGVDFSSQTTANLRLFDCDFIGCCFDHSRFVDLRIWGTSFRRCSFRKAMLREAALGGLIEGRYNVFEDTEFGDADLRGSSYVSAIFDRCDFEDANLAKVDFNGSRFASCRFAGELRETKFAAVAFGHEDLEPNCMLDVDFRRAELHWVQFRKLDLSNALLPEDEAHVALPEYRLFLERAVAWLKPRRELEARKVRAVLEACLRHAANKGLGVLNRRDFYAESEACGMLFDEVIGRVA
jgi:uncharacterized protein YjbI with pentapeptide repeats